MAKFTYVATNSKNATVRGSIEATDRMAAIGILTKQGLSPLDITKQKERPAMGFGAFGSKKVKTDDIVMFTRQLSAMISAGVPLLRGLSSQYEHTDSEALKLVLNGVIKDVESGMQLADALAKYPAVFNDVYVNMVRAGEAGGILDDILKRLALQQEKNASMRKKIKSAMIYPIVLLVIAVAAFLGMMIFVIPQIGKMMQDLGGPDAELPMLTQIMLSVSDLMVKYGLFVLPVIVAGIVFLLRWLKTPKGRHIFHRFVLKVPAVGAIVKKVAVARFARTFSALMGSGAAVLEAFEVTARAVGNVVYEDVLHDAAKQVENGKQLSTIISKSDLFPPIVAQMLSVGEETGQTDVVLVKVADFYEEEVDVAIDGISSVIEPVMIVLMGGVIGLVAVGVMMPIAGLASSVKS